MTKYLPPNLLGLFAPRAPLDYIPPQDLKKKKQKPFSGISKYTEFFEDPATVDWSQFKKESREERKKRIAEERAKKNEEKLKEEIEKWNPKEDPNCTDDPYKTLFVARISYATSEANLKREFEEYGPIKNVRLVFDKMTGKSRGYAFVEYDHERDMTSAYKYGDGRKIDSMRVLVDVERGRTVKNWRPRRLGGGLGKTRVGAPSENSRSSGRDTGRSGGRDRGGDRSGGRDRGDRSGRDRGDRSGGGRSRDRDSRRDRGGERESRRDRGGDRGSRRDSGRGDRGDRDRRR